MSEGEVHFSGEEAGRIHDASFAGVYFLGLIHDKGEMVEGTLGEEKFSFGKTAPYSLTHSLIFASRSGNAKDRTPSPSSSSPVSASASSSSESVLSAGLASTRSWTELE